MTPTEPTAIAPGRPPSTLGNGTWRHDPEQPECGRCGGRFACAESSSTRRLPSESAESPAPAADSESESESLRPHPLPGWQLAGVAPARSAKFVPDATRRRRAAAGAVPRRPAPAVLRPNLKRRRFRPLAPLVNAFCWLTARFSLRVELECNLTLSQLDVLRRFQVRARHTGKAEPEGGEGGPGTWTGVDSRPHQATLQFRRRCPWPGAPLPGGRGPGSDPRAPSGSEVAKCTWHPGARAVPPALKLQASGCRQRA